MKIIFNLISINVLLINIIYAQYDKNYKIIKSKLNITENIRIISLDGTTTEVLFALGLGGNIIGRDTSSYYPQKALEIKSVGYKYKLNSEGILSLRPSIILGQEDVKPKNVIKQIKQANIPILLNKDINNCSLTIDYIRFLGNLLNKKNVSEILIDEIEKDLIKINDLKKKIIKPYKKVIMLYIRGNKLKLILGKGTGPSKMLDYINVNNLGNEIDGAKPINAESLINLNPDVIIFFRKGVESINGIQGIKNINGLSLTNSGKNDRYVIMDDLYLGGFGPRCTKAVLDLFIGVHESEGIYKSDG